MRTKITLHLLFIGVLFIATMPPAVAREDCRNATRPLFFIENKGQVTDQYYQSRSDIDFKMYLGNSLNLFVGSHGLHYQWAIAASQEHSKEPHISNKIKLLDEDTEAEIFQMYRLDVKIKGANTKAEVVKEQPYRYSERYYLPHLGLHGEKVSSYQKIVYKNIYPQIDWQLYIRDGQIEYDFIVYPGGRVEDIALLYEGMKEIKIQADGSLWVSTPVGSVTESKPVAFTLSGQQVPVWFTQKNNNEIGFATGAYEGILVIDPVLEWSTYYGGGAQDRTTLGSLAADPYDYVVLGGTTQSVYNIATVGSYQEVLASNTDMFISKLDLMGFPVWGTYYGGPATEEGTPLATDRWGNIYFSGRLPAASAQAVYLSPGAHQSSPVGGYEAVLVKMDSSGSFIWSTLYAGNGSETPKSIACDTVGNVYMGGITTSTLHISTPGVHQETRNASQDGFVVKFDSAGVRQWGTYFGGEKSDDIYDIVVSDSGYVFLTGATLSTTDIASLGAYQTIFGSTSNVQDGFLAKLNTDGTLAWSTYFGGEKKDVSTSVCVDKAGNVYITGETLSEIGISTPGSFQENNASIMNNHSDAFIAKFSATGQRIWSTYFGGEAGDFGCGMVLDPSGSFIFVSGYTSSATGIATPLAVIKDTLDISDGYAVKFDTAGNRIWGTYIGGDNMDILYDIAINQNGNMFILGVTYSLAFFATPGAYLTAHQGAVDLFVSKLSVCDMVPVDTILGPVTVCRGETYDYQVPQIMGAISYEWVLPADWSGTSTTHEITVSTGAIDDTLRIKAIYPCGPSVEYKLPVHIVPLPEITTTSLTPICEGDTIILTATAGDHYQWLKDGILMPDTTMAVSVFATGDYQVVVSNIIGCSDTSLPTMLTVNPLPYPIITASGNVLDAGVYESYQWYHNGEEILGATFQTYTYFIHSGEYTVQVTDTNGCTAMSAPFDPLLSVYETMSIVDAFEIFPNPAQSTLYIRTPYPVHVIIRSIDGRIVRPISNETIVDVSGWSKGVYLLEFYQNDGVRLGTRRFFKD